MQYREVHLLICPLKLYNKYHFEYVDLGASLNRLHHVPFRGFQHWAIQIGDDSDSIILEVTSNGAQKADVTKKTEPVPRESRRTEWWKDHEYNKHMVQDRFLGVTPCSPDYIRGLATGIWNTVMDQHYNFATTNCQTFVSILQELIIDNALLKDWERAQLDALPMAFNPLISIGEKAKTATILAVNSRRRLFPSRKRSDKTQPVREKAPKIPGRPGKRWLSALRHNGVLQETEIRTKEELHDVFRATNSKRKAACKEKTRRRLSFGILRGKSKQSDKHQSGPRKGDTGKCRDEKDRRPLSGRAESSFGRSKRK